MQTKATLMAVLVVAVAGTLVNGQTFQTTEVPRIQCSEEVSALCPEEDGTTPEYFGDPDDCSKFCVCDDQVAYEKQCEPGLLFDENLNVCNWAFNVSPFVLISYVVFLILMLIFLAISSWFMLFNSHALSLCCPFPGKLTINDVFRWTVALVPSLLLKLSPSTALPAHLFVSARPAHTMIDTQDEATEVVLW